MNEIEKAINDLFGIKLGWDRFTIGRDLDGEWWFAYEEYENYKVIGVGFTLLDAIADFKVKADEYEDY